MHGRQADLVLSTEDIFRQVLRDGLVTLEAWESLAALQHDSEKVMWFEKTANVKNAIFRHFRSGQTPTFPDLFKKCPVASSRAVDMPWICE